MRGPSPCRSAVRILDEGFTILSDGGKNPMADIILVHGLGGHPQRSWTTTARLAAASAEHLRSTGTRFKSWLQRWLCKLSPRLSAAESGAVCPSTSDLRRHETSPSRQVFWPQDLLAQDFKNTRILTFGYKSHPRGPGQDNMYTLSKTLLSRLADRRANCPARPIIFICHSLGGILIKQALKTSQSASGAEERLKTILQSTRGIIFYATPHAGSGLANWGELLTRIGGVFSVTNTKLLAALNAQNDSGQLEELRRDFNRMLGPQLRVVNFRETRPMSLGLRLTTRFVVPLASAEIVNEWADNRTLDADHQGVCKFGGPDDVGYGDLKAVLERYLNEFASQPVVGVAKAIGDGGS